MKQGSKRNEKSTEREANKERRPCLVDSAISLLLFRESSEQLSSQEQTVPIFSCFFLLPGQLPLFLFMFCTSAPGKLILCGEHAVVYGNLAISAAIERRTYVEFTPLSADVRILEGDTRRYQWNLSDLQEFSQRFPRQLFFSFSAQTNSCLRLYSLMSSSFRDETERFFQAS